MAKPISTTIRISDKASAPLNYISSCLGKCINNFMRLNQVSSNAISINTIGSCESILQNIDSNVAEITKSLKQSEAAADDLADSINKSCSGSDGLLSTVKKIAGAYLTVQAAGKVIETSDSIVAGKQRLALALKEGEVIDEVNRKIMASANSARASYTDTLNQVSKLAMNAGDAFSNTDQAIKFVEQFNKLGALGGASVYESSQAMYQLTQSMAKGKLDGDELRSVMEGMPLVAQTIADYLGTDVGTMKELAAEGQVTAEVVRNALLGAAKETDVTFQNMPRTWSQTFEVFKNNATQAFAPVLERINAIANNTKVQSFINGLMNGIQGVANMTMVLLDAISVIFGFIYDNWSVLQPLLIGGLAIIGAYITAIGIYNTVQAISNGIAAISAARSAIKAGATLAEAAATKTATGAQAGLNAAMLASPITWILLIIIAVIAAIYGVVAAINKVTGSTISATGVIFGAIATAAAAIWNTIIGVVNAVIGIGVELYNLIGTFANFFANVFKNPVGAIVNLFAGMFDFILGIVQSAAKLIDTVLGTDMSSGVKDFRNTVSNAVSDLVGEQTVVMEKADASNYYLKGIDYGAAWDAGYSLGESVEDTVGNFFDFGAFTDGLGETDYSGVLGDIESNTGKGVDISQEDLKYLRDIAEQQAINRFTTAEIKVEMNNNNNINNGMDLDGVVDHLATRVTEAMDAAAALSY